MTDDIIARVRARAMNPQTIHDMARGLAPEPRIYPKATPRQIAAAEAMLGFALPALFRQILIEIGNGGFGPGYGLIGVEGGYPDFSAGTLAQAYQQFRGEFPDWPEKVAPICTWGCGIYSCLDCSRPQAPVLAYNPDMHVLNDPNLEATLTNEEGELVWSYQPPQAEPVQIPAGPLPVVLLPHRPALSEWITAWADGANLWEEMERLCS
jgi:hypothetical protein